MQSTPIGLQLSLLALLGKEIRVHARVEHLPSIWEMEWVMEGPFLSAADESFGVSLLLLFCFHCLAERAAVSKVCAVGISGEVEFEETAWIAFSIRRISF